MKKLFVPIIFILLVISCNAPNDSLDLIKEFQPENKYFKAGLVNLHFIIETSEIDEVNTTFNQMIKNQKFPVDAKACKDGIYKGESPYDAFDYKHVVILEIVDEKIITVDYNEVNKKGKGKKEDDKYNEEMSVTGTTPAEAYPEYEKQLIKEQNMLEVDAISGASYSLYRFRYAVTVALMQAIIANKNAGN